MKTRQIHAGSRNDSVTSTHWPVWRCQNRLSCRGSRILMRPQPSCVQAMLHFSSWKLRGCEYNGEFMAVLQLWWLCSSSETEVRSLIFIWYWLWMKSQNKLVFFGIFERKNAKKGAMVTCWYPATKNYLKGISNNHVADKKFDPTLSYWHKGTWHPCHWPAFHNI